MYLSPNCGEVLSLLLFIKLVHHIWCDRRMYCSLCVSQLTCVIFFSVHLMPHLWQTHTYIYKRGALKAAETLRMRPIFVGREDAGERRRKTPPEMKLADCWWGRFWHSVWIYACYFLFFLFFLPSITLILRQRQRGKVPPPGEQSNYDFYTLHAMNKQHLYHLDSPITPCNIIIMKHLPLCLTLYYSQTSAACGSLSISVSWLETERSAFP